MYNVCSVYGIPLAFPAGERGTWGQSHQDMWFVMQAELFMGPLTCKRYSDVAHALETYCVGCTYGTSSGRPAFSAREVKHGSVSLKKLSVFGWPKPCV